MSYTPTTWQDNIVPYPNRYTLTNNADGTVTLTPDFGTPTQAGTPVSAANMNNLETQYEDAMADMATIGNAAQLGGIPAADYIRGDAAAPNPQTVAVPTWFTIGGQGIVVLVDPPSSGTIPEAYGPSSILAWNATSGNAELDIIGAHGFSEILNLYTITNTTAPYTLSDPLFQFATNGNFTAVGSLSATSGDITGALAVAGNLTTSGTINGSTINGTVPIRVFASAAVTGLATGGTQSMTVSGFATNGNTQYISLSVSLSVVGVAGAIIGNGQQSVLYPIEPPASTFSISAVSMSPTTGDLTFTIQNNTTYTINNATLMVSGVAL